MRLWSGMLVAVCLTPLAISLVEHPPAAPVRELRHSCGARRLAPAEARPPATGTGASLGHDPGHATPSTSGADSAARRPDPAGRAAASMGRLWCKFLRSRLTTIGSSTPSLQAPSMASGPTSTIPSNRTDQRGPRDHAQHGQGADHGRVWEQHRQLPGGQIRVGGLQPG